MVEFFRKLGHEPKRTGAVYLMNCPLHQERTASFAIYPNDHRWKCFGCDMHGDIINFIQHTQGLDFYAAAFEAARLAGIELEITHHTKYKPKPGYAILERAHKLFQKALLEDMFALDYLLKRGIDKEHARYFELGLCTPNALSELKKEYGEEALQECGLLNGRSYFCPFENRLMFAYKDSSHRVVGFSARTLQEGEPERIAKYVNARDSEYFKKSKTLWNIDRALHAIIQKKQVIITEGFFDAMLFGVYGYPHAVCISGLGFSPKHLEYFAKIGVEIVFCLDNDGPGHKATMSCLNMCFSKQDPYSKVAVIRFENPHIKDMGSCVRTKPSMFKVNGFKYFANSRLSAEYHPQDRDRNYKELMSLVNGWTPFLKHACLEALSAYAPKPVQKEVQSAHKKLEKQEPRLQRSYNKMWPEGCILATMLKDIAFRFVAKSYLSAQDFEYPKVFQALINNNTGGLESLADRFMILPPADQGYTLRAFKLKALERDYTQAMRAGDYGYANALSEKIKQLQAEKPAKV